MLSKLIILMPLLAFTYAAGNPDKCANITKLIPNFDSKQASGIWYTQQVSGLPMDILGDCYKYNLTGGINGILKRSKRVNGEYKLDDLTHIQEGNTSKYYFKPDSTTNITGWWIATDYKTFALYYHCQDGKSVWIIGTRNRNPDEATKTKATDALKKNGGDKAVMMTINQIGCKN